MSTCSDIHIVSFNQSDILYHQYRELHHVLKNKPTMVSGIAAGGWVKVGVIYYKKDQICLYDLFRVYEGATLTIEVRS